MGMQSHGTKRGRRRRAMSDINVVPYIDVMLVLLIIFMVTAPLLRLGVDIQLPKAKAMDTSNDPVLVSVTSDGTLYLTLGKEERTEATPEELLRKVSAFVRQNPQ